MDVVSTEVLYVVIKYLVYAYTVYGVYDAVYGVCLLARQVHSGTCIMIIF